MCDNWSLSISLALLRDEFRRNIQTAAMDNEGMGEDESPTKQQAAARARIHKRFENMPGLARERANNRQLPLVRVPKFRKGRDGHLRVTLSDNERASVARAMTRSKTARSAGYVVRSDEVCVTAIRFDRSRITAGHAYREPHPFGQADPNPATTKFKSEATTRSDFLATEIETGVAGAVAGRMLHTIAVQLTHQGAERAREQQAGCDDLVRFNLIYARVFHQVDATHPSFGYCAFDFRVSVNTHIAATDVGGPVGLVRSPRHNTPPHLFWVIESNQTNPKSASWREDFD
jgi:hypothetical protein